MGSTRGSVLGPGKIGMRLLPHRQCICRHPSLGLSLHPGTNTSSPTLAVWILSTDPPVVFPFDVVTALNVRSLSNMDACAKLPVINVVGIEFASWNTATPLWSP